MIPSPVFDQRATVYKVDESTGRYETVERSNLECRLLHVNLQPASTSSDRDELAARRDMMWDGTYRMPEQSQVEVDGVRWQVVPGTFGAPRDWNGTVVYRRCNLVRQQVTSF